MFRNVAKIMYIKKKVENVSFLVLYLHRDEEKC